MILISWEQQQPDSTKPCDKANCEIRRDARQPIAVLNCGHSFHKSCFDHVCPICLPNLQEKIEKLTKTFNEGLLTGGDENPDEEEDHDVDDDNDDEDDCNSKASVAERPKDYYVSNEFKESLVARFHRRIIEQ